MANPFIASEQATSFFPTTGPRIPKRALGNSYRLLVFKPLNTLVAYQPLVADSKQCLPTPNY